MLRELRSRVQLWRRGARAVDLVVKGHVWVHGDGEVVIGHDVVLDATVAPIEIRTAKGGRLVLGDHVRVEGGVSFEAEGSTHIGRNVTVKAFAKIIDNHFHKLTGNRHERPPPGEVVIEEGVIVEPSAILLPGAHIGAGSVIAARAVVSKRVPPRVRVVGNPSRVEPLNPVPAKV